ncbi:hypothetical protein GQ53DRAFT_807352 [Thozetella sp. PMI_491]|nr:hypothetical protein GQ53DRAFT_807352 [Thozetella sp. PMI_491]
MKWSIFAVAAASVVGGAKAAWFRIPWEDPSSGSLALPRQTTRARPSAYGGGYAGWTPRPTPAPGRPKDESQQILELFRRRDGLDARANSFLNDETCGYYAGTSSAPLTCDGKSTCKTNQQNAVACVSGTDQPFFTVCFDFQAAQGNACNSAGALTGCCFSSDTPACQTYIWEGTPVKSMYGCGEAPDIISILNEPQFVKDGLTATTTTTNSQTVTGTASTSSATNSGGGSQSSGPSIGAIVGGVVGGIVVLALAGVVMWYCMRRGKTKNNGPAVYNSVPSGDAYVPLQEGLGSPPLSYQPGQSPYTSPGTTAYDPRQSYYDPMKQGMASPGPHPYYGQTQSPPPQHSPYAPSYSSQPHQPPMELDSSVVTRGMTSEPIEMAAETPRDPRAPGASPPAR